MLHAKIIDLSKEKIKPENAEEFIASSKFGASIVFYGTVRENNENQKVTGITYDSHDQLVIKSFKEIYNEADKKLNIKGGSLAIAHPFAATGARIVATMSKLLREKGKGRGQRKRTEGV